LDSDDEPGDGEALAEALTLSSDWDEHRDKFLVAGQAAVGSKL
jgi:hypothetical protein